jgi:hypothetical protein
MFFLVKILDLLNLIFVNAPNFHFQKLKKNSNSSNGSGSLMAINGTCNVASKTCDIKNVEFDMGPHMPQRGEGIC